MCFLYYGEKKVKGYKVKKVAIILGGYYNALSMVQELSKAHITCYALSSSQLDVCVFSRYCKHYICPDPARFETKFHEFLIEFVNNMEGKPIILPTHDQWAISLAKVKNRLTGIAIAGVSDYEVVESLIDKRKFAEIANRNGYSVPASYSIENFRNLTKQDFPIVAKPLFRRNSSDKEDNSLFENMDRLRFQVFNNKQELEQFCRSESDFLNNLVFQELVRGMSDTMFTVGIYANEQSEIKAIFTGRKVRGFPADIGDCIIGENYAIPGFIIEEVKKIVNDIGYTGIAEFEYKRDEVSGKFRLIEVNPRSWSWIGITPYAGVNIPLIAYMDLSGEEVLDKSSESLPSGTVKYVKLVEDFINVRFLYRKQYKSWSLDWKSWRKSLTSKKTVFAEFHASDFFVGIRAILFSIWYYYRMKKQ